MGSQKTSESTSYSGSSNPQFLPYAKAAIQSVTNTANRYAPYTDRALAATENLGNKLSGQYDAGSATSAQAQQYNSDVLAGNYMGGNPYVAGRLQRMRADTADGVNSQFTMGGRYGSGAHAGVLAKEMANAENNMLYGNYSQEMARRDNAMGAAYGQNNAQAGLALGAQNQAMTAPYAGMSAYAGALGNLFNGGTQKSVSYGPSSLAGALGAGLGALGSYFGASDRRLKHKIKVVGELPNGLTVYDFVYRGDPEQATYRGVMADEVKTKVPEAYIENFDGKGHGGVNYALVGMPMLKVAA